MDRNNTHINELFNRYLLGVITDDEARDLTNWLGKSEENLAQFDKAKEQWNGGENNLLARSNWALLKSKVNRFNQLDIHIGSKQDQRLKWLKIASAAAIFLLLSVGGLIFQLLQKTNTSYDNLVFETPRGQRSKVVLGDSTVIWLNSESRLEVLGLNEDQRTVSLKGQAHFEVMRNVHSPFVVHTSDYDITVLGTVFDVMAYEDDHRTITTLYEGKVRVSNGKSRIELKPGEQAVWENNKLKVEESQNTEIAKAWINNDFHFDNMPLEELLVRLGRWYDISFEYKKGDLQGLYFSGAFKNEETIWQVLDVIKLYVPIKYEKTDLRKVKVTRTK